MDVVGRCLCHGLGRCYCSKCSRSVPVPPALLGPPPCVSSGNTGLPGTHGKELLRRLDDCLSDERTTEEGGLYCGNKVWRTMGSSPSGCISELS